MAVVAGRLTALSEDRNVLPTVVAIEMTSRHRQRTSGRRPVGGYTPVKGTLSDPQLLRRAAERHNSFSFDNRLIGKNYVAIVRRGAFVE